MTDEEVHGLADRLFRAFEANDPERIRSCCSPSATFTKNGVRSGTLDELIPAWATLRERIGRHRYTEVRRSVFDHGFVEEHRVVSTMPDGAALDVVACVVATLDDDGRVIELREYVDPAGRGSTGPAVTRTEEVR